MNLSMSLENKTPSSFHRLAQNIRKRFIGEQNGAEQPAADLRVVLYSHDTMGIGHMRRNLLIASQIKRRFPAASVLAIAGAREATTFAQTAGVDCLTLPAFHKKTDGTYSSRNLQISVDRMLNLRSQTILAALKSFQPDLFIVDKVPAGAGGELLPVFEWLGDNSSCRCVLGLRDILDEPANVANDWEQSHTLDVIRKHFASIWIYGDPAVYDLTRECQFPVDLQERATFTGYLNTESRLQDLSQLPYEIIVPFVLCTVGGGQDGMHLASNFVEAIRICGRNSVLLTGPCMPESERQEIQRRSRSVEALKVVEFADEGDLLIRNSSHVVSMGGYNTVTAILSHQKPALVVPRVVPRQEQELRAKRLAGLGLISTINPDAISPQAIVDWMATAPDNFPISNVQLRMDGLNQISDMIRGYFPVASFR